MVTGGVAKDEMSTRKVTLYKICCLREMLFFMVRKYGEWICFRCAGMKTIIKNVARILCGVYVSKLFFHQLSKNERCMA